MYVRAGRPAFAWPYVGVQFYLTHRWEFYRYYHFRVDLGVMAMKRYSTFSTTPGLEPHYQMVRCHTQEICWRDTFTAPAFEPIEIGWDRLIDLLYIDLRPGQAVTLGKAPV